MANPLKIKKKRGGHRGSVTKMVNELEGALAATSTDLAKVIKFKRTLEEEVTTIKDLKEKLLDSIDNCSPSFYKFSHTGSTQENEKVYVTTESGDAACDTRNSDDQATLTDHVSNILLCITYSEDGSDLCICYCYH